MVESAFAKLYDFCKREQYRGWDIFDGLNSKLLTYSFLNGYGTIRLGWIQLLKLSPLNFRKLLLVPKGYNPKGLGLFVSGLVALGNIQEARGLIGKLKEMSCEGHSGMCWGYNFPWQARAFFAPIGTPNLVATVFVANALLDFYDKTGEDEFLEIAKSSCNYLLEESVLFEDYDFLCFSYVPGRNAVVHNVNMLGASLLARIYKYTELNHIYEKSKKAIAYSMSALDEDFMWSYGERHHHRFIDNFHTGYNLVSLKGWMDSTRDSTWINPLRKAYHQWCSAFWLDDGCPKYYNNSLHPIDIHCCAQGIATHIRLAELNPDSMNLAHRIASWAISHMQDESGYFYCQKTSWYTNTIPYMRWSQAWMFYALSLLQAHSTPCQTNFAIS